MTDRFSGFVVTLERELREDDAEATLAALRQIKGVLSVRPVTHSMEMQMARDLARMDLRKKLWAALEVE